MLPSKPDGDEYSDSRSGLEGALGSITQWAIIAGLIAGAVALGFSLQAKSFSEATSIFAAAVVVGAAAAITGSLLGFLFGIPRATVDQPQRGDNMPSYVPNTNLEQISDWVTKILVGLGLVQISSLPAALARLSDSLQPLLGGFPSSGAFGVALGIYAAGLGFVVGYLLARVRLPGLLRDADQQAIRKAARAAVAEASTADAHLLALVKEQLDGDRMVSKDEFVSAMENATASAIVLALDRAEGVRQNTWKTEKEEMERTIPIFEAVIGVDPFADNARPYANLGFALKDQREPDYRRAITILSKAIAARERDGISRWAILDWNRAVARILDDENFLSVPPKRSSPEVSEAVRADLTSAHHRGISNRLIREDPVGAWLQVNEISTDPSMWPQ